MTHTPNSLLDGIDLEFHYSLAQKQIDNLPKEPDKIADFSVSVNPF